MRRRFTVSQFVVEPIENTEHSWDVLRDGIWQARITIYPSPCFDPLGPVSLLALQRGGLTPEVRMAILNQHDDERRGR